jgi:GLPGLI family protein
MKSIVLIFSFLIPISLFAQANQGTIIYDETIKLEIDIPEEHREQLKAVLPDSRTSKMMLMFNSSESIYKDYEGGEDEVIESGSEGGGMHMKMIIQKADNQLYKNTAENIVYEKQEFFGRDFLIVDEAHSFKWKLENESKEILGYTCKKARSTNDERDIVAWFSPEIPVPNGPLHYGHLPGMILELTVDGDDTVIVAKEVILGELEEKIQAPKKGKKVSREEYNKIVDEKQKEMEEEYGSGSGARMIIKTHRG